MNSKKAEERTGITLQSSIESRLFETFPCTESTLPKKNASAGARLSKISPVAYFLFALPGARFEALKSLESDLKKLHQKEEIEDLSLILRNEIQLYSQAANVSNYNSLHFGPFSKASRRIRADRINEVVKKLKVKGFKVSDKKPECIKMEHFLDERVFPKISAGHKNLETLCISFLNTPKNGADKRSILSTEMNKRKLQNLSPECRSKYFKRPNNVNPSSPSVRHAYASNPASSTINSPAIENNDNSAPHFTDSNQFVTAKQHFVAENIKKNRNVQLKSKGFEPSAQPTIKKSLGSRKRFNPPLKRDNVNSNPSGLVNEVTKRVFGNRKNGNDERNVYSPGNSNNTSSTNKSPEPVDERLKNLDPAMVEKIENEIMNHKHDIKWDDIAGLQHAKKSIQEMVIWPMQRPDIFTGLRRAPKGILLFGPPGTGKTMIGKCIAATAGFTFFSISASILTSKWVGEGEKMVRALFAVARVHQPSVIFFDEIDALLTQRSDGEVEASRRIKTEFLIQFDGAHVSDEDEDRILLIGATNRPQEIDEAARRRLMKRFYIPLPDYDARYSLIENLSKKQENTLSSEDKKWLAIKTEGYSGSDMDGLFREASLGPIRDISPENIAKISLEEVRPMNRADFEPALNQVRASVSEKDLEMYLEWNRQYGALTA